MHSDEQVATVAQVTTLVAGQFPAWAHLTVTPVAEFGTDHCLFRIGDDLVARMPRVAGAVDQVDTDAAWLPLLAQHLPVDLPVPLAQGQPGAGYPWRWSVVPWLRGATPTAYDDRHAHRADDLADDLAAFVSALRVFLLAPDPVA